jgi:hypothetical protein
MSGTPYQGQVGVASRSAAPYSQQQVTAIGCWPCSLIAWAGGCPGQ